MTDYVAPKASSAFPAPSATEVGEVKCNQGKYDLTAALVVDDVIDLCKLPAQHVPVDAILASDDLDDGAALVMKADIYDPVLDSLTPLITNSNIGQAGGMARMNAAGAVALAPVDYDRYLRITVTTGPGTGATSGAMRGLLMYRAAEKLDR